MISIYFRPDETQVVTARFRKDKRVEITDVCRDEPIIDAIIAEHNSDNIAELVKFFDCLSDIVDLANDDVYVVLPDYIFSYIEAVDCTYINETNLLTQLETAIGGKAGDYLFTYPIETKPPASQKRTVYALKKLYVDKIIDACKEKRIALTSIEPASFSFFRAYQKWNIDTAIVEMFPDKASIITYSPAGGLFRSDAPTLSEKHLLELGLTAKNEISTAYAANDFACSQTFAQMRTDFEYIALTNNKNIRMIDFIKTRSAKEIITLPDMIIADDLPAREQVYWMAAIGTLLQCYDESIEDALDNPTLESKPAFININNANLLPQEVKDIARSRQWKRVIARTCRLLSACFIVIIILESAGIFYFSNVHINPKIKTDYEAAKVDIDKIAHELNIIKKAKAEDNEPLKGFEKVVASCPNGLGLATITIGKEVPISSNNNTKVDNDKLDKKNNKDDKKSPNNKKFEQAKAEYIKLTAAASDEMLFQDFRAQLDQQDFIVNPYITAINGDKNGLKTAEFTIGRK